MILAGVSALAFGSAGVCAKAALDAVHALTPLRVVEFRITGAAVVLHLIIAVLRRRNPDRARVVWNRETVVLVVLYGVVAFAAIQGLYFFAITRMPVGVALLIEYLAPAMVAVWVAVVRRRRQPVSTWGGIALTVLGLSLIAQPWDGFVFDALGVTAALIAAVALAAYFLLADAAGPRVPPLELCAWAATAAAVLLAVIQPWWTFPFAALGRPAAFGHHHVAVWLVLIVVVGVGTVIAYLTGIAALALLPTSVAAVLATLEIVVASVFAWFALDEHLSAIEIVGALVLMTGATLAQRGRDAPQPGRDALEPLTTDPSSVAGNPSGAAADVTP